MRSNLLFILFAMICCTACNGPEAKVAGASADAPAFDMAEAKSSIAAGVEKFSVAFNGRDSAAIAGCYTADAKVFPPNMPQTNREGMGAMIKSLPPFITKSTFTTTDLYGHEDGMVEEGQYQMGDSTKTIDSGKYLVIWKKEGGQWKMHRDIWNSDQAAMSH